MDVTSMNARVIEQYRAGGAVDGMDRDHLLLLTTTGRRSGLPRTSPLMFVRDGDRYVVVGSNLGAAQHPDWYRNVLADPQVTVEVGGSHIRADAATAVDGEHERLWALLIGQFPFYDDYQVGLDRKIPLVVLTETA